MQNVRDIRKQLIQKYKAEDFVIDKSGVQMVELIGATFLADEPAIYGTPNENWHARELAWYQSMSLNVNDIPEPIPTIWKEVSSKHGFINSNYGYLIWSDENHNQYDNVLKELQSNPFSRRAEMIYTRPSIWKEYNKDGMSDWICTDSVQYFIRSGKLVAHVRMRSNDLVFGYKGDYAWQRHVQTILAQDLGVDIGDLIWTVGSAHVYERHLHMIAASEE
jgi:thymidylate synthase